MSVPRLARTVALACLLLLALCAAPAAAATVAVSDGVLTYAAGRFEPNTVTLAAAPGGGIALTDAAALTAPACAVVDRTATCPAVTSVVVDADDFTDVVTVGADVTVPVTVSDGSGNDTVRGGGGLLTVVNGSGNDAFTAGPGGAVFRTGSGRDVFTGSTGPDLVDYSAASRAVTATVDGAANDGVSREYDTVGAGIDRILGSPYHDRLVGGAAGERLEGGAGDDALDGGAGADRLEGGDGTDVADYGRRTAPVTIAADRRVAAIDS